MASLARIRPCAPRRLPFPARAIQTAADTTQLQQDASHSEPFNVKLHDDSFRGYHTDVPSLEVEVTKDGLLTWYKQMNSMRRMEMAADALYKQKLIRGFCHLAIGQEAISVGIESATTFEDKIISSYRTHPSPSSAVAQSRA
ncbi:Pyruvate dehydrogenase E1 component subunit alpha, mitochondrial [Grifola frondosa]|uniref:Pyruvate dehydrogenase E1 component subunit alpha, mitochondrial n=1 Tax=Grifola frondosa TaxID=5627 RepID=A0A1C7LLQ4_GRIFR|nr:Pyruvate dehydrogenase E1 component subunit alpha, mitochondrial [Grifola frondosa]